MVAAVIVSIAVKLIPTQHAILCGVVVYAAWVGFLLIYWYVIVVQAPTTTKGSKVEETIDPLDPNTISWKQKIRNRETNSDSRLPVTIVTGYLGSGKTTLIKNILNNTVGMVREWDMSWYGMVCYPIHLFIDLIFVCEESSGHRERDRCGRNRPRAVDETHRQGRNHSHE